jgi:hypothetical protein
MIIKYMAMTEKTQNSVPTPQSNNDKIDNIANNENVMSPARIEAFVSSILLV